MAAGPSSNVSTGNENTTAGLTEALLDHKEESHLDRDVEGGSWWAHVGRQSENGVLLRVEWENEEEEEEEREMQNVVTEILLYAAVAKLNPAPPDGNLPKIFDQSENAVKVYALPLCSNIINRAKKSMEICSPSLTDSQSAGQAWFLPHTHDPGRVMQPAPQKRQSISTLFEDATKKRRKFKGRGGESVSQAMAGIDRLPPQYGLSETQEAPLPQQNDLRRKSLSRASSMTSITGPEYPRPASHSGPLPNRKQSLLHRVESAVSPRDSPTPSDADGSCVQQNKAALTKVVMAAMRLHGLQQKKKPPSKSQRHDQVTMQTETNGASNEAEDEYKLVYHQTFKAAVFTFRKDFNIQIIPQERMRDTVDELLTIFCTDPMFVDHMNDYGDLHTYEAIKSLPSSSPFDKPSSQARSSTFANGWNTPMVKKH